MQTNIRLMDRKAGRHVLVVGTGSLLDDAIRGLLMREIGLQVTSASSFDVNTSPSEFGALMPDVIVTTEVSPLDRTHISELLHRISPGEILRVIIVRMEDNILEVYDKQSLKMTRNEDLISLIKA